MMMTDRFRRPCWWCIGHALVVSVLLSMLVATHFASFACVVVAIVLLGGMFVVEGCDVSTKTSDVQP